MISFYTISKRIFLKHKGISHTRVISITQKEYAFAVYFFVKVYKGIKSNI